MLVKYVKLYEATNLFQDCGFKVGTRILIPTFERLDDELQSEHEITIEMVALLQEFEMISKWL